MQIRATIMDKFKREFNKFIEIKVITMATGYIDNPSSLSRTIISYHWISIILGNRRKYYRRNHCLRQCFSTNFKMNGFQHGGLYSWLWDSGSWNPLVLNLVRLKITGSRASVWLLKVQNASFVLLQQDFSYVLMTQAEPYY